MFEQLLLAIDDTPASELATIFAASFAQRCSASVHVLHVNEFVVGGARGLTLRTNAEVEELLAGAVQQLRENGVRASATSGVASYRHVPKRIAREAHDRGVDAIVLGSNRHGFLGRLFSSQVRERTTRLTSLPLFVAPSPLKIAASLSASELVREAAVALPLTQPTAP